MKKISMKPFIFALPLFIAAQSAYAYAIDDEQRVAHHKTQVDELSPFYFGVSAGYNAVSGTVDEVGGIVGRLVLGVEGYETGEAIWGIELGAQSGNDLKLDASEEVVGEFGQPIRATLEPLADILITLRTETDDDEQPWGVFLKAGVAYRELNLSDRTSDEDSLQKIAPEVQAGIAYQVSDHARLVLYYQGIYSEDDAGANLDEDRNTQIEHIPTQQAGFLGVEYRL